MTSWESISHHRQRGRNSPLSPSRASRKFSSCVSPYRQAHSPEISEFLSLGKLSGCSELGLAASRTSSCSVSVTFGSASTKSSSFFFFFFFFFSVCCLSTSRHPATGFRGQIQVSFTSLCRALLHAADALSEPTIFSFHRELSP